MKREYKLTINSKSIDLDKVTEAIRQITGGTVDIVPVNVPKSTPLTRLLIPYII